MEKVNIHKAKTNLSRLVDRAAKGEEIIISRAGKPVARLVALEARLPRHLGLFQNQIQVGPDFDDLPEDLRAAFEGGE